MDTFITYIQDHVALTVVLAVILVLIVVFVVLLAVEIARSKKRKKAEPAAPEVPEETPVEDEETPVENEETPAEHEEPATTVAEEPSAEPSEPAPSPQADETPGFVFVPVKKDRPAPEAAEEEQMKQDKKTAKPAAVPVAAKKKPAKKETVGKWVLYEEERGGYGFKLVASNGEVMLKSSSPYASLSSAKSGVKTYQDNIAAGRLEIVETKKGNFFVQVNNASKRLLATSADYKTRTSCESAMESIKRWAATTVVVVETPEEGDKK